VARFVIVGAGLAGAKAAEAVRERSADTEIVLVGDEPELPYERPPLSKGYLKGESPREEARVHTAEWYPEHRVDLRTGVTATAVDTAAHTVTLADGTVLSYDKLLLATGSHARTLPFPGADAAEVYTLRRADDADRLKDLLGRIKRLVVIGAGWIGLEVTAAARDAGVEVTVVESADLPLVRILGPELATVFADLHREHGVDFRFGASIAGITTQDGVATGVELADGTLIGGEAVLMAVGAAPNLELATAAGLDVDAGVLVDASLRTSDPDVFAVGDIAQQQHPVLGRRVRVEHWATALNQPAVAAAGMLGESVTYDELPYFFTDQYDLGMEYVGLAEPGGYDEVAFRGDLAGREFVAFWLKDGRVVAGMNVNVWDVVDAIKALILSGKQVDRDALTDPAVPLDQVLAS